MRAICDVHCSEYFGTLLLLVCDLEMWGADLFLSFVSGRLNCNRLGRALNVLALLFFSLEAGVNRVNGYSRAAVTYRYGYCAVTCRRSPTTRSCTNFPCAFTVNCHGCCFDFHLFMTKMYSFEVTVHMLHSKQN